MMVSCVSRALWLDPLIELTPHDDIENEHDEAHDSSADFVAHDIFGLCLDRRCHHKGELEEKRKSCLKHGC